MFIDTPCTYLMFSSCIKMFYFYLDTLYLHPYLMFSSCIKVFTFYLDTLDLPLPDVFLLYQDALFLFRHPVPTPLPDVVLLYQDVYFLFGHPVPTPTWCFPPVSRCFLFYLDTLYLLPTPYLMFSSCIKMFLDLVQ